MKILFLLSIRLVKQATSEHLISAMIDAVCKKGHSVHIIQKGTGDDDPAIPDELATLPVTTDIVPYGAVNKRKFFARYLSEIQYYRNCRRYIDSDYDAVFIQSTTTAGYATRVVKKRIPKARITFNVQDIFPHNLYYCGRMKKGSLLFKYLKKSQQFAYIHSDSIIAISEDMKEQLVEDGISAYKIDVIYNWSYQDRTFDDVDLMPVEHMFNPKYFNVVYAGNIGVMQNVDILVEAANLLKHESGIWFHIIGNGVYKERLVEKTKLYGISNMSFWNMQPHELAPAVYSSADVNVIPLMKNVYRTALPSKTATCLACHKPIIFAIGKESRYGQKVMKETNCPVVESDSPEELVSEILNFYAGNKCVKTDEFYLTNCGLSENSNKYAMIITNQRWSGNRE